MAWIQQKNSCDITQGKSHEDFCRESLGNNVQVYQEESGQMDGMQGVSAIQAQEKKIQQRKGSHRRYKSEQTKGAEGAGDGMQPNMIRMPSRKQQNMKKKAVSANQMDKQRVKSNLRRTMFQQMKRAEDLANGMDVRNTASEKLGYKVIEEEIITASAKAAGDEAAT